MGLDINVLAKPKPGHEAEFEEIWRKLNVAQGTLQPRPEERGSLLGRLFGRREKVDTEALTERFQAISIPPYAAIDAPVVGRDEAANAWLQGLYDAGKLSTQATTLEAAMADFDGYFALEAMPDCDGFPVYSNAYHYEGVDRTSFRGAFLEDCKALIGKDLLAQAWNPMLARDLGEWASALRDRADAYAKAEGLEHLLGQKSVEVDINGPDGQLHIVDQAARWARFWSERGHGSEPYF